MPDTTRGATFADRTTTSGLDDGEDWVSLPRAEASDSHARPSSNTYLDFQMSTILGMFSFRLGPATMSSDRPSHIHRQDQSPLFQLPVEIRLYIYTFVFRILTTGSGVELIRRPAHDHTPTALTVLLTCRQLHLEAEDIFYSINRLSVREPQFWASLTSRRRAAITAFTLPAPSPTSALEGLQQLRRHCPNLKSLFIECKTKLEYLDVSSWAIMAPQLVDEIGKMARLERIEVICPKASDHDTARRRKIDGIDQRLCGAVRSPPSRETSAA